MFSRKHSAQQRKQGEGETSVPLRFFLLDKNLYRQDSNKFYKLLETSFNVARKKMIHIRFFVQFLSLKAMKPIKIFLWGITPTLLSSNPLVTVYGNYRGLSGPHLSIVPSTSQDTQCINQCSVSPVWTPSNFSYGTFHFDSRFIDGNTVSEIIWKLWHFTWWRHVPAIFFYHWKTFYLQRS